MADTRIQARLPEDTHTWLEQRRDLMHTPSASAQAQLELGMWQSALRVELRRIRLTLNQVNCVADVLNGAMMSPGIAVSVPVVYAELMDAFELDQATHVPGYGYADKWGIKAEDLLGYLRTLGPTADHALHDAVARWWKSEAEPTVAGWASVGLRVVPSSDSDD